MVNNIPLSQQREDPSTEDTAELLSSTAPPQSVLPGPGKSGGAAARPGGLGVSEAAESSGRAAPGLFDDEDPPPLHTLDSEFRIVGRLRPFAPDLVLSERGPAAFFSLEGAGAAVGAGAAGRAGTAPGAGAADRPDGAEGFAIPPRIAYIGLGGWFRRKPASSNAALEPREPASSNDASASSNDALEPSGAVPLTSGAVQPLTAVVPTPVLGPDRWFQDQTLIRHSRNMRRTMRLHPGFSFLFLDDKDCDGLIFRALAEVFGGRKTRQGAGGEQRTDGGVKGARTDGRRSEGNTSREHGRRREGGGAGGEQQGVVKAQKTAGPSNGGSGEEGAGGEGAGGEQGVGRRTTKPDGEQGVVQKFNPKRQRPAANRTSDPMQVPELVPTTSTEHERAATEFFKAHIVPLQTAKKYSFLSDICRLALLYLHGGFYLDHDMQSVEPLVVSPGEISFHPVDLQTTNTQQASDVVPDRVPEPLPPPAPRRPWFPPRTYGN